MNAVGAASLARLIRRICLLREQGNHPGAEQLETGPLAAAVREFRTTHGPEALPESELQAMFALEEKQVIAAAIISELLLPQLVESMTTANSAGPNRPAAVFHPRVSPPAVSRAAASAAGPPVITELLDAMLAAERRPSPGLKRPA